VSYVAWVPTDEEDDFLCHLRAVLDDRIDLRTGTAAPEDAVVDGLVCEGGVRNFLPPLVTLGAQ